MKVFVDGILDGCRIEEESQVKCLKKECRAKMGSVTLEPDAFLLVHAKKVDVRERGLSLLESKQES
jgi:hypothetical protein